MFPTSLLSLIYKALMMLQKWAETWVAKFSTVYFKAWMCWHHYHATVCNQQKQQRNYLSLFHINNSHIILLQNINCLKYDIRTNTLEKKNLCFLGMLMYASSVVHFQHNTCQIIYLSKCHSCKYTSVHKLCSCHIKNCSKWKFCCILNCSRCSVYKAK